MVGKYVTTTRRIDSPYGKLNTCRDRVNWSTGSMPERPRFSITNGASYTHPIMLPDYFPLQTTTSYRSVGSPLGPSQDEVASILSKPQRLIDYSPYDTGHTFSTSKEYILTSHPWYVKNFSSGDSFQGPLSVDTSSIVGKWNGLPALPTFDQNYFGRLLISQAAPTVPHANLLTTAAEILREGISLPGRNLIETFRSQTGLLRGVGGEYLNAQFGWLPLLSEFQNVLKSVLNTSKILSDFEANSGLWVRRRRSIPIFKEASSSAGTNRTRLGLAGGSILDGSALADLWQSVPSNTGSLATVTKQVSREIWFSGAFSFYLQPDKGLAERFTRYGQLANHLLGLRLTPEVLWELTPWSWLVDYFVDIGRALKLVSLFSNDGLVMKYGYLMCKTTQNVTVTATFPPFKDGTSVTVSTARNRVVKSRYRATPYGFGLDPTGFSNRQWAILGALGLSKAPKTLP